MTTRVLCLLTDGFEEIETVTPVDLLRRAGIEVTLAGLQARTATGRSGITLTAEALLSDLDPDSFDLLLLPGGPGVNALRADGRPATLAVSFHQSGKPVAAICAAPLVLHDAGLLEHTRFTAHSSTYADLPGVTDERVVEDGLIITSRGAGTALDFSLALVRRLAGSEAAAAVSASIMA